MFHDALSSSFPVYFPVLKDYFENNKEGVVDEKLTQLLNRLCFEFLMQNIKQGNNWSRDAFDITLNQFVRAVSQ